MEATNEQVFKMRDIIIALSEKHNGDWNKIYDDIKNKVKVSDEEVERCAKGNTFDTLTILDSEYPEKLKRASKPPFVIYYQGDLRLLTQLSCGYTEIDKSGIATGSTSGIATGSTSGRFSVSILQDNTSSSYSVEAVRKICSSIINEATFIVAFGSSKNNELIKSLIEKGAKMIAVVPVGIGVGNAEDKDLYNELVKNHLVISTYPEKVSNNTKQQEAWCSKLLSVLADKVVVGGLSSRSPQCCGIGFAVDVDNKVYVLPFPVGSKYINNTLIKEGANLLEDSSDLKM